MKRSHVPAIYNGVSIHFDDKVLMNLTDMWKAMGSDPVKAPAQWMRTDTAKEFVSTVANQLNCAEMHVLKSKPGRYGGGSYAHWQIALAYAQYLSPEFHLWCNSVTKERFEEMKDPELAIDRGIIRAVTRLKQEGKSDYQVEQWLATRLDGKAKRLKFTSGLSHHGVSNRHEYKFITDSINFHVLGKQARDIKKDLGLKAHHPTRDYLSAADLAWLSAAEANTLEAIDQTRAYGAEECSYYANMVGQAIHKAKCDVQRLISENVA